jgi:uncharacterized protein (TIGR02145 family)
LIPEIQGNLTWSVTLTPAMCWYDNDSVSYKHTYGGLYNWYVVNQGNLCPVGWHVPTDNEWNILFNHVNGDGGKLKDIGLTHWGSPNANASNETGFTALPSGYRTDNSAVFQQLTAEGSWWSSTSVSSVEAASRSIMYLYHTIFSGSPTKRHGSSIRCIKD